MGRQVRIVLAGVLAAALMGVGGCLVSVDQHETRNGRLVSEGTFSQITVNETKGDWLRATLGEPSEKSRVDEHSEIWKWAYSTTQKKEGYVFLIYCGKDEKQTDGAVFVELKDGVVVRKWRS